MAPTKKKEEKSPDEILDDLALYETIIGLESPCNWKMPDYVFGKMLETVIAGPERKIAFLEEPKEGSVDTQFKWRRYILCAHLSLLYYKKEDLTKARQMLEKCRDTLRENIKSDPFFESIKSALYHVLNATEARYYFDEGEYAKAQKLINSIKLKTAMNKKEKAGLLGIKTALFNELGAEGSIMVEKDIREAVDLNPNEVEWNFLLGKVLRRIRKFCQFFNLPDKDELAAFEKAFNGKKCAVYALYAAISFKELGWKLYQKHSKSSQYEDVKSIIGDLNKKSLEFLEQALQFQDLCVGALSKIGRCLMELPYPYKNAPKAKELMLRAVEMDPNSCVAVHSLAMFYERQERDLKKALEYNVKALMAGSYGSGMDIIKISLRLDSTYDPLPMLSMLKTVYKSQGQIQETSIQEGCYYVIVKKELYKGLAILMEVLEKNPDLHSLNECKPIWLALPNTISVYELLYHELKSDTSKENTPARMSALLKIKETKPELFEKPVDRGFLEDLIQQSEANKARYSKQAQKNVDETSNYPKYDRGNFQTERIGNNHQNRTMSDNWRNRGYNGSRDPVHRTNNYSARNENETHDDKSHNQSRPLRPREQSSRDNFKDGFERENCVSREGRPNKFQTSFNPRRADKNKCRKGPGQPEHEDSVSKIEQTGAVARGFTHKSNWDNVNNTEDGYDKPKPSQAEDKYDKPKPRRENRRIEDSHNPDKVYYEKQEKQDSNETNEQDTRKSLKPKEQRTQNPKGDKYSKSQKTVEKVGDKPGPDRSESTSKHKSAQDRMPVGTDLQNNSKPSYLCSDNINFGNKTNISNSENIKYNRKKGRKDGNTEGSDNDEENFILINEMQATLNRLKLLDQSSRIKDLLLLESSADSSAGLESKVERRLDDNRLSLDNVAQVDAKKDYGNISENNDKSKHILDGDGSASDVSIPVETSSANDAVVIINENNEEMASNEDEHLKEKVDKNAITLKMDNFKAMLSSFQTQQSLDLKSENQNDTTRDISEDENGDNSSEDSEEARRRNNLKELFQAKKRKERRLEREKMLQERLKQCQQETDDNILTKSEPLIHTKSHPERYDYIVAAAALDTPAKDKYSDINFDEEPTSKLGELLRQVRLKKFLAKDGVVKQKKSFKPKVTIDDFCGSHDKTNVTQRMDDLSIQDKQMTIKTAGSSNIPPGLKNTSDIAPEPSSTSDSGITNLTTSTANKTAQSSSHITMKEIEPAESSSKSQSTNPVEPTDARAHDTLKELITSLSNKQLKKLLEALALKEGEESGVEDVLKILSKKEKKKGKVKHATEEEINSVDEGSVQPRAKRVSEPAGNQIIRLPKGPSEKGGFSFGRKK